MIFSLTFARVGVVCGAIDRGRLFQTMEVKMQPYWKQLEECAIHFGGMAGSGGFVDWEAQGARLNQLSGLQMSHRWAVTRSADVRSPLCAHAKSDENIST